MMRRLMTTYLLALVMIKAILGATVTPAAAAASLDTGFKPVLSTAGVITGIAPLPADGKVMVIGRFTSINGVARKNIARLNADGTVDTGFQLDTRIPADMLYAVAVQADGKVLIGGQISVYGLTESQNYLFRVSSSGVWDETFKPGRYVYGAGETPGVTYGLDAPVRAIVVDTNGKILVGGDFTVPTAHIARLNPSDGSVDTSFTPGSGADGVVTQIALQTTGHIVIGGAFGTVNGTAKARIARLGGDGLLDSGAFGSGIAGGSLLALALQSDNKVLLGGTFNSLNGTTVPKLVRTDASGSLDGSFTQLVPNIDGGYSQVSIYYEAITSLLALPDKIIVGGWNPIMYFGGTPTDHNAQVYALAGSDGAFIGYTLFRGKPTDVWSLARRSDGLALAGGSFTQLDDGTDAYYYGLCQLDPGNYYRPLASWKPVVGGQADIRALALQSDGKLLVGGDFYLANGVAKNGVARFNSNGSLDNTLTVPATAGGTVTGILVRDDGNLVMGGSFYNIADQTYKDLALLGPTGNIMLTAYVGGVNALAWYPGGKILVAMPHTPGVKRLNADLTADDGFVLPPAPPGGFVGISNNIQSDGEMDRVNAVAVQPDGKVLVVGSFSTFSGITRQNIVRLNADGSIDSSFSSPAFTVSTFRSEIFGIALQTDGKILLVGRFSTVGGQPRPTIVRLNPNGGVDTSFASPFPDSGATAYTVLVQSDGKLVVGGSMQIWLNVEPYTTYNNLFVLNPDGSRDTGFSSSASGAVKTALVAPYGTTESQLLAGGGIEAIDSTSLFGVARFTMPALQYLLSVSSAGDGTGTITGTAAGTETWSGAGASVLYNLNTVVTLTAQAGVDSTFNGWSGAGCSGTGSCTVTMSQAQYVTATFTALPFPTLTVTRSGVGDGSVVSIPSGTIDCPAVNCSSLVAIGSTILLTAVPNASSTFGSWTGCSSATGTSCSVTMGVVNKTVTATFNAAKAQIGATGYATLADAYTAAASGAQILLLDGDLGESLTVTKSVVLKGGYNAGFTAPTGLFTNLTAPLTVSSGTLTISTVVVK